MRCEDYPCCGHTPLDPCDPREGATREDYALMYSRPDYDPYYDDWR